MPPLIIVPEIIISADFIPKVLPLINEARHSIKIIVFDWRLYPTQPNHPVMKFISALQAAQLRGCSVQVLIRNPNTHRQLRQCGFNAKILHSGKLVHAKMMLIDDRVAIVGSHNYTQSGLTSNLEISIAFDLGSEFNDLSVYFKNLWPI